MDKKGADGYHKPWKKSNYDERDANGRTKSGLYRYLKPYYKGREGCIDEYGNDIIEKAIKFTSIPMRLWLGPNETEAHLRPDFGRVAVSEVGMESANLRKSRGFQRLDRGSGEFEKVHWRGKGDTN